MTGTKKQYLRQLKRALRWRLSQRGMIQDVVADYEGFFDDGIRAGQAESELCAQFGPPRQTARELSRAEGFGGKPVGLLAVAVFVLTVLLNNAVVPGPLYALGQILIPFLYFDTPMCAWLTILLIPLLWGLWRKTPLAAPPEREKRGPFILTAAALLLWLAAMVTAALFLTGGVEVYAKAPTAPGYVLLNILAWVEMALAAVLLVSLLRAWRKSIWYLVPAACCQGIFAGVGRFFNGYHLTSLAALPPLLLCGLLVAALCAVLVAHLIRRGTAVESQSGDRNGRRLVLPLLWLLLTLWLTRGIGPLFDSLENLPLLAAPFLLPFLCLLWREIPKRPSLSGKDRRERAVLFALPFLFQLAYAGLLLYVICNARALKMHDWGMLLNDINTAASLSVTLVILLSLVKYWPYSTAFFLTANCVGILASLGVCIRILSRLDVTATMLDTPRYILQFIEDMFTPYALVWLGAGAAFLMQKLWRHYGRTA